MNGLQIPPDAGPPQPSPLPGGLADTGQDEQQDPLAVLQECIQALPGVIASLPDPQDTQDAIKALQILAGIQTRLMRGAGGAPTGG